MEPVAFIGSVLASTLTVGGGFLVARRFQKIGGGEAQERVNKLRAEVADAAEERVKQLEVQFSGCKSRLIEVEDTVKTLQSEAAALAKRWGRERIDLKQQISDLHAEIRTLRVDRRGAKDRTSD